MYIIEALKIIIAKSPNAAEEAIRAIAAARNNSPILQIRYSNALTRALADPQANFTPEEREILSSVIESTPSETREFTLRIRLTDSERADLQTAADADNLTMSEYARRKIFS